MLGSDGWRSLPRVETDVEERPVGGDVYRRRFGGGTFVRDIPGKRDWCGRRRPRGERCARVEWRGRGGVTHRKGQHTVTSMPFPAPKGRD